MRFLTSFGMTMVLVLLLSCMEKQPEPLPYEFDENLQDIDTLLQHDAVTALQKLLSCHSEYEAHYQALLTSEALYKTDNPQLNRFRNETFQETSLQDAMHYFDSLAEKHPQNDDITLLSARSHYMNGVGYYENDSVVDACKEYLHTLDIMEGHFVEPHGLASIQGYKAKFMGLTYTRLGQAYFNNGVGIAAIESFKNALAFFEKIPNYQTANTYRYIGSSYNLNQQLDSSLYYYRKAIDLAKKQNKPFVYGSSLSESAPIYYEMGYIDSAFMMIRESFLLPMNDDQRLATCFTLGYLYKKQGECDSAIYYLSKGIKRESFATQAVSAELLMNCYEALGDTISAKHYKEIYGYNFTKYRHISDIRIELTKLYEAYKQEQLQKTNQVLVKKRNRPTVMVLMALLAVITIVTVVFKLTNHKNMLANKDKALAEMKRKLEANPFMNEPICKSILNIVNEQHFKSKVDFRNYREFALSKDQLLALRDAVDRHYNNFTQRIQKEYPELTYDDVDYCCLYLLGVKDAEISALMQKDYSTVCYRRRKINSISNMDKILVSNCNTTI